RVSNTTTSAPARSIATPRTSACASRSTAAPRSILRRLRGFPELDELRPDPRIEAFGHLARNLDRADELDDVSEIFHAMRSGHSRRQLELEQLLDGKEREMFAGHGRTRGIRKRDRFRLPVAGEITSEDDVDVDV